MIPTLLRLLPLLAFCAACHDASSFDSKVPVGGLSLHVSCKGKGSPPVVLDSGLGNDARAWARVQPAVAKFTQVCAYDRAGLGSSSPAPRPHSNRQMAAELNGVLAAAKVPAPYVLVGHSMGGTNVQLYLASHPQNVAGMVLVDASPEPPPFQEFPPAQVAEFERSIAKLEGLDLKTFLAGFDELAASKRSLGKKPLAVLVAGRAQPEPFLSEVRALQLFEARQKAQYALETLSENRSVVLVRESTHHIPLEAPDAVVHAIRAVVDSVRSGAALTEAAVRKSP